MADKNPVNQAVLAGGRTNIESQQGQNRLVQNGGDYHPEGVAGSLGRAKNTAPVSDTRSSSSRSGLPSRKGSGKRPFGGLGSTMANSSRLSQYPNRNSQSHALSIASSAFFRPLSSSRLQAQRAGRPNTGVTQENVPPLPLAFQHHGIASRQSLESDAPTTPRVRTAQDPASLSSRGTDINSRDHHDRISHNGSPSGDQISQSVAESTSPLQPFPQEFPIEKHKEHRISDSFRNTFRRASQQSPIVQQDQFSHKELYSHGTNSPQPPEKPETRRISDGKNYQYFSGNTVFCMGGRLQNARDRPVNIATGILVVLPGVLFFVFW